MESHLRILVQEPVGSGEENRGARAVTVSDHIRRQPVLFNEGLHLGRFREQTAW